MKKTSKKPFRHRFEVLRDESGMWAFVNADTKPAEVLHVCAHKGICVASAVEHLRFAWTNLRVRSELAIKGRDGSIQDKRTYGDDPRETKG